jgi:WhiB family redox-sensing transcriptional regulator
MTAWRTFAACRGKPTALWFSPLPHHQALAIEVCSHCPVRQACLDDALGRGEVEGVWGGTTPGERAASTRSTREVRYPECDPRVLPPSVAPCGSLL